MDTTPNNIDTTAYNMETTDNEINTNTDTETIYIVLIKTILLQVNYQWNMMY